MTLVSTKQRVYKDSIFANLCFPCLLRLCIVPCTLIIYLHKNLPHSTISIETSHKRINLRATMFKHFNYKTRGWIHFLNTCSCSSKPSTPPPPHSCASQFEGSHIVGFFTQHSNLACSHFMSIASFHCPKKILFAPLMSMEYLKHFKKNVTIFFLKRFEMISK
jgi:hypothetical protein